MKIKLDKFSFEMTDKDSQNILNFFKWFTSLSDKEQLKILGLIFSIPTTAALLGTHVYKTIKEERRKDKELDIECRVELKAVDKKQELKEG